MEALEKLMSRAVEPLHILRDEVVGLLVSLVALIPNLVAASGILLVTWAFAWVISHAEARALRRSGMRQSLQRALLSLTRIAIWIFGLLIAATVLFPNLTPTKLLAGLGLGSIAIGLAFKDIFENFLSGILILIRKPMQLGDDIECEGVSGRVEEITLRDTYLRQRSGELVLVPNSFLFKNPIRILTDLAKRRISLVVGLPYDADLKRAHGLLAQALDGLDTIDADHRTEIFVTTFNESSIDVLVRWWTGSTPIEELRSRNQVAMAIKTALDAAGIEIPFPQRTLTFAEPLQMDSPKGRTGAPRL